MCSIEDCARIKLAELAMKEYGLLKDISYRNAVRYFGFDLPTDETIEKQISFIKTQK